MTHCKLPTFPLFTDELASYPPETSGWIRRECLLFRSGGCHTTHHLPSAHTWTHSPGNPGAAYSQLLATAAVGPPWEFHQLKRTFESKAVSPFRAATALIGQGGCKRPISSPKMRVRREAWVLSPSGAAAGLLSQVGSTLINFSQAALHLGVGPSQLMPGCGSGAGPGAAGRQRGPLARAPGTR